jgi:hypothetical protein
VANFLSIVWLSKHILFVKLPRVFDGEKRRNLIRSPLRKRVGPPPSVLTRFQFSSESKEEMVDRYFFPFSFLSKWKFSLWIFKQKMFLSSGRPLGSLLQLLRGSLMIRDGTHTPTKKIPFPPFFYFLLKLTNTCFPTWLAPTVSICLFSDNFHSR